MVHVTLREMNPASDFPRLVELLNAVQPEPTSVEWMRESEQHKAAGQLEQRTVAVANDGQILGNCNVGRSPWMPAGQFWCWVNVDAAHQRQGIGSLLYEHALQWAAAHQAGQLRAEIRDHLQEALQFAQRRGFRMDRHIFQSRLDLATFDQTRFTGVVESAEAQGLRFFALADVDNTEAARRKLYELDRRTALDIPGRDLSFAPFEEFSKFVFGASWYRADGQLIAADGDQWVGLAAVGYFEQTQSMTNMMTGVDRSYRGRGLALALKLLAIRCAQRYGVVCMRTENDSQNAPMLALNRQLGYQPEPGLFLMLKDLSVTHESG